MRTLLTSTLLLLCLNNSTGEEPVTIKIEKVNCELVFPSQPTKKAKDDGELYQMIVPKEDYVYTFRWVFSETGVPDSEGLKNVYDAMQKAVLDSLSGKLGESKDERHAQSGLMMRSFTFTYKDRSGDVCHGRWRFLRSNNAVLQICVIGQQKAVESPQAKEFLDSLKVGTK